MHIPLNWDEDPTIGWESTLAGFSQLPPNFLKKCKANFSWVMANVNITVSTSKTTSEPPGFSDDSGEVEIDGAGDKPRKRNRTATRTNLRKDEDWVSTTPVKRSARKPVPKVSRGKREQPTFKPKLHVWNKMKVYLLNPAHRIILRPDDFNPQVHKVCSTRPSPRTALLFLQSRAEEMRAMRI